MANPYYQNQIQGTGRANAPAQYGPPGVNSRPTGRPPDSGGGGQNFGGGVGHQGPITGPADPNAPGAGGWGYYWGNSGRNTGAGGMRAAANALQYDPVKQTDLSRAAMGYAQNLLGKTPEQLGQDYYRRGENIAIRSGQAGLQNQLRDMDDQAAMSGFGGPFAQARRNQAIQGAGAERMQALDQLNSQALQFGEQAGLGRLAGGVPWQGDEQGRRQFNAANQWQAEQQRRQMQASAARAGASGQERILRFTDPNTGQEMDIPEYMYRNYVNPMYGG